MKFRKLIKQLKRDNVLYINDTPVMYNGQDYVLQDDMCCPTLIRRHGILDGIQKYGVGSWL